MATDSLITRPNSLRRFLSALLAALLLLLAGLGLWIYLDRVSLLEVVVKHFTDYRLQVDGELDLSWQRGELQLNLDKWRLANKRGQQLLTVQSSQLSANWLPEQRRLDLDHIMLTGVEVDVSRDGSGQLGYGVDLADIDIRDLSLQLSGLRRAIDKTPLTDTVVVKRLQLSPRKAQRLRQFSTQGQLNGLAFSLQGDIQEPESFSRLQSLAVDVKGTLGDARLRVDGQTGSAAIETSLRLRASTDDLAPLLAHFDYTLKTTATVSFEALLQRSDEFYQLNDVSLVLESKEASISLSGSVNKLFSAPEALFNSRADVPHVTAFLSLFDLSWDWQTALALAGELHYSAGQWSYQQLQWRAFNSNDEYRNGELRLDAKKFLLSINDQHELELSGQQGQISFSFSDNLGEWQYSYPLDSGSFRVAKNGSMHWQTAGQYRGLSLSEKGQWLADDSFTMDVSLGRAQLKLKGQYDGQRISARVDGVMASTAFVEKWMGENATAIDSGRAGLNVSFDFDDDSVAFSNIAIDLSGQLLDIQLTGEAGNIEAIDDINLQVAVQGDTSAGIARWLSASQPQLGAVVSSMVDIRSWASDGSEQALRQSIIPQSEFQQFLAEIALEDKFKIIPTLNGKLKLKAQVLGKEGVLDLKNIHLAIDGQRGKLAWQGEIDDLRNNIAYRGDLTADLKANAFEWFHFPATISSHIVGTDNSDNWHFSDIQIRSGDDLLSGQVTLLSQGKQPLHISGAAHVYSFNFEKFFGSQQPVLSSELASAAGLTSDKRWIPDLSLDFSGYADVRGGLDLAVDKLVTPFATITDFTTFAEQTDSQFVLRDIKGKLGATGLTGAMTVENINSPQRTHLHLLANDFTAKNISQLTGTTTFKSGDNINFYLDISGEGKNLRDILASANGMVTLEGKHLVINGDQLSTMAPEVLSQVAHTINPFYDKKQKHSDSKVSCGIVHFEIKDGVMTADNSIIVVTPKVIFGAHGSLDLANEKIRMQFVPNVRTGLGLSLKGSMAEMAIVVGSFSDPKAEFDPTSALLSGTIDVAGTILYGPLYWLYLGQAKKLLASSSSCDEAIKKYASEFTREGEKQAGGDTAVEADAKPAASRPSGHSRKLSPVIMQKK